MSKQTAVEWLVNEIDMQFPSINIRHKEWILDQAKRMEREQIEEAFDAGVYDGMKVDKDYEYHELADGETYYEANYEEASHEA